MSFEASAKLMDARMKSLHHTQDDLADYRENLPEDAYLLCCDRHLYGLINGELVESSSVLSLDPMDQDDAKAALHQLANPRARVVCCREIVQEAIDETHRVIARLNKMGC